MNTLKKLTILADAAKYDASCASSGAAGRTSTRSGGIGSTESSGICHSYAPDGRCISLLKILLTNYCIYDCRFCINRNSSNVPRARFSVDEVVMLTLDFYRRNYIEGLFLSSGIIQSSDYTMEELIRVAKSLRNDHRFQGYIHLKAIPDADPVLLTEAGLYADRLSLNVELPTQAGLSRFAPEKTLTGIEKSMDHLKRERLAKTDGANRPRKNSKTKPPRFMPGGQSTQMIVGADGATDRTILSASTRLYSGYRLKRVYYSAFSPIPDASRSLPLKPPPLVREHRLYQADWLLRFYSFRLDEIVEPAAEAPASNGVSDVTQPRDTTGMLDLDIDPKLAWALRNRACFPVDLNRADRSQLLRVPGLGVRNVKRLLAIRRHHRLRLDDLANLNLPLRKILPFVEAEDHHPGKSLDRESLRRRFAPPAEQPDLFAA